MASETSEPPSTLLLVKRAYYVFALLVGLLIILKSTEYYTPNFEKGFLIGKSAVFPTYQIFLYSHIIGAPVALLTGLFQFSFKNSIIHQKIGLIYVVSILTLAGPGGFGMSFFALGGTASVINFLLLSTLWMLTTVLAFFYARQRSIEKHRTMMVRSFILTNSAVLIRLFSYLNHQFQILDLETGYVVIAWLSWLPGLLIYEVSLMKKRQDQRTKLA